MQKIMSNQKNFRVYTSQYPIGVQLGGAHKKPLAVEACMIVGMGFLNKHFVTLCGPLGRVENCMI
jgi:glycerol-3-phosphate dehydrogenase